MTCERCRTMLDDYVDGALDADAKRAIQAHLETCAACRASERELRSLLLAAGDLPREIEPPRDLLPGIRAAVRSPARASSWTRWAGLAASLFLLSAAVITFVRLGSVDDPKPASTPSGGAVAAGFEIVDPYRAAEEDYLEATRQLLAAVEERRGRLSPETQAVLDKNLAIIDRAIAEIHAALEAEPGNPANELVLSGMYQQKIELLRRISRLSS